MIVGAVLGFVASAVVLVGEAAALWWVLSAAGGPPRAHVLRAGPILLSALLPAVALGVVSLAVWLVGIFVYYRRGVGLLARAWPDFSICRRGVLAMGVGLLVALTGLAAAVAGLAAFRMAAALAGLGLLGAGLVAALVGYVLAFVVAAFKLNGRYGEGLFVAAGVLYVLSLALAVVPYMAAAAPLLGFIGDVLMYAGLGRAVSSVRGRQAA